MMFVTTQSKIEQMTAINSNAVFSCHCCRGSAQLTDHDVTVLRVHSGSAKPISCSPETMNTDGLFAKLL